MDHYADRNPEICTSLGLECRACVQQSAANVALVCAGMTPAAVRSTFLQLYPSPMCSSMAPAFMAVYAEATTPRKPATRAVAAEQTVAFTFAA